MTPIESQSHSGAFELFTVYDYGYDSIEYFMWMVCAGDDDNGDRNHDSQEDVLWTFSSSSADRGYFC